MSGFWYKGYTDKYIPIPDIAKVNAPGDICLSQKEYKKIYEEEMDEWAAAEAAAEDFYDAPHGNPQKQPA